LNKMRPKIIFTREAQPLILEALGYSVRDGLIIDPDGKPALTSDGRQIEEDRFGGFVGDRPIRDDLFTIMSLVEGNF